MLVEMMKAKIHRVKVTDKHLEYEGSITIDSALLDAAGIRVYEKVHVLDLNNGERFETYAIEGKKGSGEICVNGAAARLVEKTDTLIIISYGYFDNAEAAVFKPTVVKVDEKNRLKKKSGKDKK
jgi:aspartate 1-decarboxylase